MNRAAISVSKYNIDTILDVLKVRAEVQADEIAYRFLSDGEEEKATLTYGELNQRARQIAAELQRISAPGQRALLLDSSELDYIVAFFGCLCAGVIAVPVYPPRGNKRGKGNARIESVVADAEPSIVLTAGPAPSLVHDALAAAGSSSVTWVDTSTLPPEWAKLWVPPSVSRNDIAFLQYTSGSTSSPKGVMVSHANILHNEEMIQNAFRMNPASSIVGWLPLFHDMGLIGNVLQPLYAGVPCTLMSPVAFLQRPLRWLQAISRYQATTSGGPNFAYELCIRKIREEDLTGLDLSSWRVAFDGAEPVRMETMERFAARFADCGFRRKAFVPCYGLAEGTLFVSGGLESGEVTSTLHGGGSGNNRAKRNGGGEKTLVGCGRPPAAQTLRIVSTDSLNQCLEGQVGEIWIKGLSVARGYWRRAKESEETFSAIIRETGEGPFLRTGDLGFLKEGELFVTGRLKDLLIIRGQNYYPQDIELTVEQTDSRLHPGCGAAFSTDVNGEERLVVVQEAAADKNQDQQKEKGKLDAIIRGISKKIVASHELQPYGIVLIKSGTIPKTSSGKIQRHVCKAVFQNGELQVLREWYEGKASDTFSQPSSPATPQRIASWVRSEIASAKGLDPRRINLDEPFAAYGFDSLAAIEFGHKLQVEFGVEVDVSDFFGDSTIAEIMQRASGAVRATVGRDEKGQPAIYALSHGQRALWVTQQMAPDSCAYNISRAFRISGSIDVELLKTAFQILVDRHPLLRTTIIERGAETVQQVADIAEVSFGYYDATEWSDSELKYELADKNKTPFRLTEGPLFRVNVYRVADTDYVMHISIHHIVSDLWSLKLLFEQAGQCYEQLRLKNDSTPISPAYTYADFVAWQSAQLAGPTGEQLWSYWKHELSGDLSPLSLPTDRSRPSLRNFQGSSYPVVLNPILCAKLKQLAIVKQTTLFAVLLAAFEVLLHRLSGQNDVVVGCPATGRSRAELAQIVGYFVNPVPIRSSFTSAQSFVELLSHTRATVSGALSHDMYPFALMVEKLASARDSSGAPIVQTMFVFQNTYGNSKEFVGLALEDPEAKLRFGGLQLEPLPLPEQSALVDLVLTLGEGPGGVIGTLQYDTDLFDRSTIARWADNFQVLLEAIVARPDALVSDIEIMSEKEREALLEEFNRTSIDYEKGYCIHQVIERQAQLIPSRIAAVHRGREVSYADLNAQANGIARILRHMGVARQDLVGVCMSRSPQMIAAMLAIWKAGGGYVPLDPQYPRERIRFMLEDAAVRAIITESAFSEMFDETVTKLLYLDEQKSQIERKPTEDINEEANSGQVAYLIYTSGSTGVPKGVMLSHRGTMSLVSWAKSTFSQEEFDGVLASTSICFDLSVFELWATLCAGGTVVLADDLLEWWEHRDRENAGHPTRLINTVPSAIARLIEEGPLPATVRTVNLAGEALPRNVVSLIYKAGKVEHVNNLYGPSETTTYSTWASVKSDEPVMIGRGVANTQLYVLDQWSQLAPLGAVGELYIAGDGLAYGYWKRPILTAERFLPNPFRKSSGARMYRTGDLVRWHPDGRLEYLGRTDQQIKLRGYRIELGEIEASLCQCESVQEAVVTLRATDGDERLIAYAVAKSGMQIDESSVRADLKARLPQYMIPSQFVVLPILPRTPNGKIDRNALPEPPRSETAERISLSEVEEILTGIWAEVLPIGNIGPDKSFFELGGHSLLAVQVTSRIRQVFHVELPLRAVFETPTVAGLARRLKGGTRIDAPSLCCRSREQLLPLSFGQERLWFLSQYELNAGLYNVPVALRLRGDLNVEAIGASLREIVARHEVLRTSFPEINDRPAQSIAEKIELRLEVLEVDEDQLAIALRQGSRAPFDLRSGPLIRASLFKSAPGDYSLLVVLHHIVCDGWSLGIMLRELGALYDAFSRGAASPLQPLPIQFADFSEWQREGLRGNVLDVQLEYWKRHLESLETLDLPTDRPYPAKPTLVGSTITSHLSPALVTKLKATSRKREVTLFMTLVAAFDILMHRYTGQTDIVCGSPVANRSRQEIESLIGFFVNTLVLRCTFSPQSSVVDLLREIREASLQAYAHQDIPFEQLVEALDPIRDQRRSPLFQIMFVLQNAPLPNIKWSDMEVSASVLETGTSKFDLTVSAREKEGRLDLSLEYRTELFDEDRMKRLLQHYQILLEQIVVCADTRISEMEILTATEKTQILTGWNDTQSPYPMDKCVNELFEEQAQRAPQAVAIVAEDTQITYEVLNRCANQLAHYLKRLGVAPEVRVGVCVERHSKLVVALMAILKAGGTYVPLDPSYPIERLSFMIGDADALIVLTDNRCLAQMTGCSVRLLNVDSLKGAIAEQSVENPSVETDADNLAWLIYTSGSTGQPKGTSIRHGSAVSLIHWARGVFTDEEFDGVLASTSICFDLSTFEIFVPLSWGGTVVIAENALHLSSMPHAERVRLVNTVPSAMAELVRMGAITPETRTVNLAGEALSRGLVDSIYQSAAVGRVFNLYGPSEDTTYSTYIEVKSGGAEEVSIGRPVSNTEAYVLDGHMQPLPVGVNGELYLGGAGQARGYLNRPELTAEKFVPNPFGRKSGDRLYRTGDLIRFRADGNLEFLGRLDYQVKIRGYRIEMGEIEAALLGHPSVAQAVVVVREDQPDDKRLVGYIVRRGEAGTEAEKIDGEKLRSYLFKRLPKHMVPWVLLPLDRLPLTPNGKIDRKALPAPKSIHADIKGHVAPRTTDEEMLAGIFAEVLGLERVGIEDNFFELGGHSLLTTQVVSRVRRLFGADLSLRQVFESPTVAELAKHLARGRGKTVTARPRVERVNRDAELPLSLQQERLWFLDQIAPGGTAYNLPGAVRLKGDLNKSALRASFQEIVRRHEILRTSFVQVGAKPKQRIHEAGTFDLVELDLRANANCSTSKERLDHGLRMEAARPFTLSELQLFRATLFQIAEQEHILLVTVHHIVFDGWSVGVLVRELRELYQAYSAGRSPLPDLAIQYADYATWQRERLAGGELTDGLEYWRKQLKDLSILNLPTDYCRPAMQSFQGTTESWEISADLSAALRKLSRSRGVTLFMTVLTGFQILLARYSGQQDVVVGSPIANRVQPELAELIGFFVNTIVLRANLAHSVTIDEALGRTREACLDAYAYQSVPFENLVDELEPQRDLSHNPLFQVAIVLQNAPGGTLKLGDVEIEMLPSVASGAKFDLTLVIEDDSERLHGTMEYCTDLFDGRTVRQMLVHYRNVLAEMVQDTAQPIWTLPLLSAAERRELLIVFRPEVESTKGCVHELFERWAELTPHAVALECGGQTFTYGDLNQRANQLGHYIMRHGVSSEELIGMVLPHRLDVLVGMLAVLKAGAAFLLLDTNNKDRSIYALKNARPTVLLSEEELITQMQPTSDGEFQLDMQWDEVCRESVQNLGVQVHRNSLAYVTYDFAHSDVPEGVAIQHDTATSVVCRAQSEFSTKALSRVLSSNAFLCNFLPLDTYVSLCCGGTLVSVDGPVEAISLSATAGVTLINSAPSAIREMIRRKTVPSTTRAIVLASEAVSAGLLRKIYEGSQVEKIFVIHGSSGFAYHSSVSSAQTAADDGKLKPAAFRADASTRALALDDEMELLPVGVYGQLYLEGIGLARGYFNRPDVTAAQFLPNPFSQAGGERLYSTGDLGRRNSDGDIEFRGRGDVAATIRGHRLDLPEIETALLRLPEVADAVVLIRKIDADTKQLVAYVIPQITQGITGKTLERSLRTASKGILPDYMVPSKWVTLERLPLHPDGTLDCEALSRVSDKPELPQAMGVPENDTEKKIAEIWKQILKRDEVGVDDNFFEVGGHSLIVPEVLLALQQAFGTNLELVELLQYPTIHSLAERVDVDRKPSRPTVPAVVSEITEPEERDAAARGFAVIGMACRFPGARNIEEFWRNLRDGVESVVRFSDDDLRHSGIAESVFTSSDYVKYGAIIDDVELFDARFFNLSAREAELIDPQQRVLLEIAWEALENAGYGAEAGRGRVGVYAGSGPPTYLLNQHLDHKVMHPNDATPLLFANASDFLATRVAYKLNLTGPSITVQAACSTSLVTAHMACRALLNHECDIAIAGGVTIRTPQVMGDSFMEGGITSPDGHTRTFDERAQGMVRANGAGVVVLKRLPDAIRDRDCIHAIIRGSAINNDGSQKVSYAAPSVIGQRDVIEQALRDSGVNPETISYVETHGTATPLGDPIEITALTQAFHVNSNKRSFCAVGSVKSNIGHTDCAAGVSGLIKTVLALEHKQIPATLHYERPNPKIDFANSPFYVNAALSEWAANGGPRRAGVSAFGIGGTNAHIVLEEASPVDSSVETRPYQMLMLSARTSTALDAATNNLADYLPTHNDVNFADVAYTLHVGRREFNHRRVIVSKDPQEAISAISSLDPKRVFTGVQEPGSKAVVFMFPGQGSQYVNMARGLYDSELFFRQEVDRCATILRLYLGMDIREVLFPNENEDDVSASAKRLLQTEITQPALFVIEYALARLWMEWGVRPHAMVGHSVGEFVAATLAGVFSLEDALALVSARGRLMQTLPSGVMLVVPLPEKEVIPLLNGDLSLAAVNSTDFSVLSGTERSIRRFENELAAKSLTGRRLQTSHAFHSAMMDPILEPFAAEIAKVCLNAPNIRYLSNLSGTWITDEQATNPEYWVRHLRDTVRFADSVAELVKNPDWVLLEVGPGQALSTLVRRNSNRSPKQVVVNSVRHPEDSFADEAFLLAAAGKLWVSGVRLDWKAFYGDEQRKRVALPTYPFERERYWLEPKKEAASASLVMQKKRNIDEWFYLPSWKKTSLIPETSQNTLAGPWLIFCDRFGFGVQLRTDAQRRGIEVVSVVEGTQYAHSGDSFSIRPAELLDYQSLFADLEKEGKTPAKVIYLWTLASAEKERDPIGGIDLGPSFFRPLFLAQALGALANAPQVEWIVVSNYLYDVIGESILNPERATALSYCRVVPQEYPNISCRNVDLDLGAEEIASPDRLSSALVDEIAAGSTETVIAYRRGRRWEQAFEALRLPAADRPLPLRQRGTYLITGGLGGIGLTIAEHFAKVAKAQLVLVGRSQFPSPEDWEAWIDTHGEDDKTCATIRRLKAIEETGAKVLVLSADVSDEQQMQSVIRAAAEERFGPLHGVLHCAGVPGGGLIQLKTPAAAEKVLAAKVKGTMVLASVLGKMPLDFFIAWSSLRSIAGAFGQIDYCAANAFLDVFAHYVHQNSSSPMVAINWDGWAGIGMLAKSSGAAGAYLEKMEQGLSASDGVEALMRILYLKSQPQVIVSTRDIDALILQARSNRGITEMLAQTAAPVAAGSRHPRPAIDTPYHEPSTPTEHKIAEIWQEVLGVDQIGINDNIFDLGGDSVQSIQIAAKISQQGFQCTPELVFRHQTIAELAAVAAAAQTAPVVPEAAGGYVPLTPAQSRFFEQLYPMPQHHNQSILLNAPGIIDTSILRRAIGLLAEHHDALRARFELAGSNWRQELVRSSDEEIFSEIDLTKCGDADRWLDFDQEVARLESRFDLAHGPLFHAAFFCFGAGVPGRLLLIAHSLVADRLSMAVLVEDLNAVYRQLLNGDEIHLSEKTTTSYQTWARKLTEFRNSPTVKDELGEWLDESRSGIAALPVDLHDGENSVRSASTVVRQLERDETYTLLEEMGMTHRAQPEELLLTALESSVNNWTRRESLLVDLETSGRGDFVPDVNLSRTVGAFENTAPVLLLNSHTEDLGLTLKSVKDQVRRVPKGGLGYGLLRYHNEDPDVASKLKSMPQSEIRFSYLGNVDQEPRTDDVFTLSADPVPNPQDPQTPRGYLFEVVASVLDGRLSVNWTYSTQLHHAATAEMLAGNFVETLRGLIALSGSAASSSLTPSDFPLAGLDEKGLRDLEYALAENDEFDDSASGQETAVA